MNLVGVAHERSPISVAVRGSLGESFRKDQAFLIVLYLDLGYIVILRFILHAWPGSECVSSNKIYIYVYIYMYIYNMYMYTRRIIMYKYTR